MSRAKEIGGRSGGTGPQRPVPDLPPNLLCFFPQPEIYVEGKSTKYQGGKGWMFKEKWLWSWAEAVE
jgi:hypothetical protein